jgi:hypothetical protein
MSKQTQIKTIKDYREYVDTLPPNSLCKVEGNPHNIKVSGLLSKVDAMIDLQFRWAKNEELPMDVTLEAPKDTIETILKEMRKANDADTYPSSYLRNNIFYNQEYYVYTGTARIKLVEADVFKLTVHKEPIKREPVNLEEAI